MASGRPPLRRQVGASSARRVILAAAALATLCALAGSPGADSGAAGAAARASAPATVWLCRPGLRNNPCISNLTTTIVDGNGSSRIERAAPAPNPSIDCFYVYPNVSTQPTLNANLHIDPQQRSVAREEASRFSQTCRVYAPMYPEVTLAALHENQINPRTTGVAYRGLLAAWNDYLIRYNKGRGVVLIGASEGAALLIGIIKREIDPDPAERRLLVSALLMGGNVLVAKGAVVGGDFVHVPACRADTQTGCVVAFSAYSAQPPPDSSFGRPSTSVNGNDGIEPTSVARLQVLCANPASLPGGPGPLIPYFPQPGRHGSAWVSYPGLYRAQCKTAQGATWLQVTDVGGPNDTRPVVQQATPAWGLHDDEMDLTLGNLVDVVRDQSAAYAATASH